MNAIGAEEGSPGLKGEARLASLNIVLIHAGIRKGLRLVKNVESSLKKNHSTIFFAA